MAIRRMFVSIKRDASNAQKITQLPTAYAIENLRTLNARCAKMQSPSQLQDMVCSSSHNAI